MLYLFNEDQFITARKPLVGFLSNCTTDQHILFHFKESTILYLLKSKILSLDPFSETVLADLCQIWSETLNGLSHSHIPYQYIPIEYFAINPTPWLMIRSDLNSIFM